LAADGFAGYALRIGGLVASPRSFSYAELKAMPKQEQITTHFCIQGWSGVAKWGGVPMRHILELVRPAPEARYAVLYSLADGSDGGRYYDVHRIENMHHALTILAYEMNGKPVSVLHGAPLRLRCENELGFKMVKWIAAIEFVRDFADLGAGQGGYKGSRILRLPDADLTRAGPQVREMEATANGASVLHHWAFDPLD
jgi:DMSO/TMAO reductase YedYZ molybdopterin-dependent catalytic subunit